MDNTYTWTGLGAFEKEEKKEGGIMKRVLKLESHVNSFKKNLYSNMKEVFTNLAQ